MANTQLTRQRGLIAEGFTPYVRRIRIGSAPDGSQQVSGFTIPARAVIQKVFVDVRVAEATGTTKTLDVGRTSDADGYIDGVDVSTVGVKKATLASGAQTLGALLRVDEGGTGELVPEEDVGGGGETVTFSAGSGDFVELRADIYVVYYNLSNK